MNEPFGIEVKFNVLHKTGKGINSGIMRIMANAVEQCAFVILNDQENEFNHDAQKCSAKLYRQVVKMREKAYELEKDGN
jgi:ribosomal protein S24E